MIISFIDYPFIKILKMSFIVLYRKSHRPRKGPSSSITNCFDSAEGPEKLHLKHVNVKLHPQLGKVHRKTLKVLIIISTKRTMQVPKI